MILWVRAGDGHVGVELDLVRVDDRAVLDAMVPLGRALKRRADGIAHRWTAVEFLADLWAQTSRVPPDDWRPDVIWMASSGIRQMHWLATNNAYAAELWNEMVVLIAEQPDLVRGEPARGDVIYCDGCDRVRDSPQRGRRWCVPCESATNTFPSVKDH